MHAVHRYLVIALLVIRFASPIDAQTPPGPDGYAFPAGGKAGSIVEMRLGGTDWTPDIQFFSHDPRIKIEPLSKPGEVLIHEPPYWFEAKSFLNDPRLPREVKARVTLPADLPEGIYRWSVASANGAGRGGIFHVSQDHELHEEEDRKSAQEIPGLPVIVNGRLRRIEEVDLYRFRAAQDGPITCELIARQLGSNFLGVIDVRDAAGQRITDVVDTEGLDPKLTFHAKKGEYYTLAIRDLDYRGYRNFVYRLRIHPGPRVITAIPPAGKRGTSADIEFIGMGIATGKPRLEHVTRRVAFPANPKQESLAYILQTPLGNARPHRLLLSNCEEQIQNAPGSGAAVPRELTVPAAITAAVRQRGQRDTYHMKGKKGEIWDVSVQSESLGSPLQMQLQIQNAEGKNLSTQADEGNKTGICIPFTLPADGSYMLVLTDRSGKSPKEDSIYRLEVQKPESSFQLQSSEFLNIPIGGKASLIVDVTREGSFNAPIALAIRNRPDYLRTAPLLLIPASAKSFALEIECAADAPAQATWLEIIGTARVGEQTIQEPVRGRLSGNLASRDHEDDFSTRLLVATTLKPPFKITAAEADGGRRIPRGSTHQAEVLIERVDGFTGEIVLDMAGAQQRHRQGIRGPAFLVGRGQKKVEYPVFLPEWLETTRTSRIGLVGMAQVTDPRGTPRYVLTAMEGQITMSIEGALLKLAHGPEEWVASPGETLEVPLTLARSPRVSDPVQVQWLLPDQIRDLIDAKPFIWPAKETTTTALLHTKASPRLEGVWRITARASVEREGGTIVSETTFEVEFRKKSRR